MRRVLILKEPNEQGRHDILDERDQKVGEARSLHGPEQRQDIAQVLGVDGRQISYEGERDGFELGLWGEVEVWLIKSASLIRCKSSA